MTNRSQDILIAARQLLITEGGAKFSLRRVADSLEMSLGNLQYYYPSRQHLLEALLEADVAEYRKGFQELRREDQRGKEALEEALNKLLSEAGNGDELTLFRALLTLNEPWILEAFNQYYRELYGLLEEGLAQISGKPKDSPPVKSAATLLFPYLDGYETTRTLLSQTAPETAEMLTTILWTMLQAEYSSKIN